MLTATATPAQVVTAAPSWRVVDFISDLHLQASDRVTFDVWQQYMQQTSADALFILGDLFEVWVGDDLMYTRDDPQAQFAARCQQVLQDAARRMRVYFLHGNRDFLLGTHYAEHCGMHLLSDPSVLAFDGQRWLVSHGDALCLDDTEYQQFRCSVRSPTWQAEFLSKPLSERQQIARGLRCPQRLRCRLRRCGHPCRLCVAARRTGQHTHSRPYPPSGRPRDGVKHPIAITTLGLE
jgi:UDP-2,3-diacylglucosamine hydrolase